MYLERLVYKDQAIRTFLFGGEIYLNSRDVCNVLCVGSYKKFISALPPDEQMELCNGEDRAPLISENGLYQFLLKEGRLSFSPFIEWLTRFALPLLRKSEKYVSLHNVMDDPDAWVKLIRTIQQYKRSISILENSLKKKEYLDNDAIIVAARDVPLRMMPIILQKNDIKVSKDEIRGYLMDMGFLDESRGRLGEVTQKGLESGFLKRATMEIIELSGEKTIGNVIAATPEGQLAIIKAFLKTKGKS